MTVGVCPLGKREAQQRHGLKTQGTSLQVAQICKSLTLLYQVGPTTATYIIGYGGSL